MNLGMVQDHFLCNKVTSNLYMFHIEPIGPTFDKYMFGPGPLGPKLEILSLEHVVLEQKLFFSKLMPMAPYGTCNDLVSLFF